MFYLFYLFFLCVFCSFHPWRFVRVMSRGIANFRRCGVKSSGNMLIFLFVIVE
jgi:hypothetical protein